MDIDVRLGIDYARHDGFTLAGDLYAPEQAGTFRRSSSL